MKYVVPRVDNMGGDGLLTPRERGIAQLIARGYSNRRIAEELVIAPSTAERHVANILAKLNLRSRTEVALWAVERRHLSTVPRLATDLTSFIGRERELAELERLLRAKRLVTLTGSGGIGKTRLATQLVDHLQAGTQKDIAVVELASLSDGDLVLPAVASTLGIQEKPNRSWSRLLGDALRDRRLLLLLDNCEHVVGACAALAEQLLTDCRELRILATSREPLRVRGETLWRVSSLSLPPEGRRLSLEQVAESEAVRLFIDRAQVSLPEFALDDPNCAVLAQLCRRLDGIPLALELAAAWVATLSVEQIAERLDDALALLTTGARGAPARQQTLRATLDWSHSGLTETEQRLFARLSVFAGGWTLEAAETVCADEARARADVLDGLRGLVAKSLVVSDRQAGAPYRYRLLETIRQYASEKLAGAGEHDALRWRHADFFLAFAESHQPLGDDAVDQLEQERDNLRASYHWFEQHGEGVSALRVAGALGRFWKSRYYVGQAQAWATITIAWFGDI